MFLVVIVALILVHEIGHFIVAKLSSMRVDEFGIGYPPRALTIAKIKGTEYTLNWLPFGGFVKIYGEDGTQEGEASAGAFSSKARILQALTLIAGVTMNVILAYVLLTATLIMGTTQELEPNQIASSTDAHVVVAGVDKGSAADKAGFQAGDTITSATIIEKTQAVNYNGNNPGGVATLVGLDTTESPMQFKVDRNGKELTLTAMPKKGVIASAPNQVAMGFSLAAVGTVKTPLLKAPLQGLIYTWNMIVITAQGLWHLLVGLVTFKADLSQVAGPVGIAGIVGNSVSQGLAAVLSLAALISINLAIVNLIPVPALDGGRLLFVIIESITRKPISPKIANAVNAVGFALLILLMLVITAHDIWNLVH